MSGIKRACNRPKIAKHLRSQKQKRFKNENPEKLVAYKAKLAHRANRKRKKRR